MYSQFLRFWPAFSPLANNTDVAGSANRRFEYYHRTNNEHLWDTKLVTNGEHAKCSCRSLRTEHPRLHRAPVILYCLKNAAALPSVFRYRLDPLQR